MQQLNSLHIPALATGFLITALVPAAAETAAEHYKYLHAKCGPALAMSKTECDCIVTAAKSELDSHELGMVVMFVKQDEAGIVKMQTQLTNPQMTKAVSFVTDTPRKCRNK